MPFTGRHPAAVLPLLRTPLPAGWTTPAASSAVCSWSPTAWSSAGDTDLDAGLAALQEALRDLGGTPLEALCDTRLARMPPADGADDVAIVAVRTHTEDRPRPPEAGPNRLPPGVDQPRTRQRPPR